METLGKKISKYRTKNPYQIISKDSNVLTLKK